MRYRLLVNLGRKIKAGSIVTAEDLGEGRIEQLRDQGFLEVYVGDQDETAERSAFEAALDAYRLHMEAAPALINAVLAETMTDDQIIAFADALFEISTTVPKKIQRVMGEVFERARELALADPENIPNSAFASLSTAAAEGAAGMETAPEHNAPAADPVADVLRGFGERFAAASLDQVNTNPEGGAVVAETVVTTSEAQAVASSGGAVAATAASNVQPVAKAPAKRRAK